MGLHTMSDDLVKRADEVMVMEGWAHFDHASRLIPAMRDRIEALAAWIEKGVNAELRDQQQAMQERIADLEAALREIEADCDAEYPPSHGAIKYRIRAALEGEKT